MITKLDADQLTAAVSHLIDNLSPHTHGYGATVAILTEFLTPLTHEGLRRDDVKVLLERAEDWRECGEEAASTWAQQEGKSGSWRRHEDKAHQKMRVAAMSICEGGRP